MIAKAVKARWDAEDLGDSVTGGLHNGRPVERSAMPYCIFTEIWGSNSGETVAQRTNRMELQFDVYVNNGNPETAYDLAILVRDAFVNADRAATDPFDPDDMNVTEMRLGRAITTRPEGDEQVFRSMFTVIVAFNETVNRTPA